MNELTLFNSLFGNDGFMGASYGRTCAVPEADVVQTKNSYMIYMNLPGRSEKDVEITLKNDVLVIKSADSSGEKNEAENENVALLSEGVLSCSRSAFKRSFTMPKDIDAENVKACFKNGVLTVEIGRKEDMQEKKIEIKAA